MGASVWQELPSVYADVAVRAGMAITLAMDGEDGEGASINFGHDGPQLSLDFADVDSLERLAAAAADGARQLRERIAANARRTVRSGETTGRPERGWLDECGLAEDDL
jgi:hypothetical protein